MYFIDVGQVDATLIVADTGESLLIDGGSSKVRIRERLSSLGVADLDAVLATHPDSDHIAGLVEVFDLYPIARFYWNGQAHNTQTFQNLMVAVQTAGVQSTISRRGDTIPLGELTLQVLPPSNLSGDSNVDSIVVLLTCGTVEIVLTGDAETPSESEMLSSGLLSDIDVYKVGLHGSRTSTSGPFLDAIAPEFGVISAGLVNQYGHPHQEVVDRLASAGVALWYTDTMDQDDTVRLVSDCETFAFDRVGVIATATTPTPTTGQTTATPTPTPTPSPTPTPTATPAPTVVSSVAPGTIFVIEMMPNPSAVRDSAGEWFEVFNSRSDVAVDINGWTIRDAGANVHVSDNVGPLVIPPQSFLVLGINADTATNGGVAANYVYSSFTLANSADEIELVDRVGTIIDTVAYTRTMVFKRASSTLAPTAFNAAANDSPAFWCAATTEMMPNPAAVSDTAGEWFEVFNSLTDAAVDINGWTIRDLDTNVHVINAGAPLLIPPQSFLVLGRSADTAINGGAAVDYQYSSFTLANSGDEIELVDSAGAAIDAVAYSSSLVFSGASATLSPTAFDAVSNNLSANWCAATSAMAGGDKGTPGGPNDPC